MYRLLRRIGERSGVSVSKLAEVTGLDRSTLGRNLRVLEKQGLVEIATGTDQRARAVTLTEAGATAIDCAMPLWVQAQDRLKEAVGPDLDVLMDCLDRLASIDASTERSTS